MGVTYVEGVLTGPTGKHATVRFWVDSGATYTLVPHDVSKALDLAPKAHRCLYACRWHYDRARRLRVSSCASRRRGAYACHPGRSGGRSAPGSGHPGDLRAYPSSFQAHAGADAHAPRLIKSKPAARRQVGAPASTARRRVLRGPLGQALYLISLAAATSDTASMIKASLQAFLTMLP